MWHWLAEPWLVIYLITWCHFLVTASDKLIRLDLKYIFIRKKSIYFMGVFLMVVTVVFIKCSLKKAEFRTLFASVFLNREWKCDFNNCPLDGSNSPHMHAVTFSFHFAARLPSLWNNKCVKSVMRVSCPTNSIRMVFKKNKIYLMYWGQLRLI